MREFDDAPPARESPAVSPTRRKKRWRCLGIVAGATFLSLLIGFLVCNGPGFRAIARFGGLKAAAAQGLKGDFTVTGSLASGFAIKNVDLFDCEPEGTSIQVEEIVLDYRGLGLVLDQAATIADLAGIPVRANLAAEVPSLAETTADFGLKLPLTGSLSLEAREIDLARGRLDSGNVLLESKDLAWDGIALSAARIAARIERENFVRLAADLGLDENTRVHLAASTDLTAKTYEGEAAIALDTAGRLGTVLADLDKALFTGAVSLDWKGRGGFAATGHQGEASVSLRAVTVKSGHPIDGSIAAAYSDKPVPPVKATGAAAPETIVDAPAIPAPLATLDLSLKGDVDRPSSWDTTLAALLSGLSWNGMALENISLDADTDATRPERPLVARVKFDQSSTLLDATARLDLAGAESFADLAAAAVRVDASLGIGSVATLLADFAPPKLKALPLAGSLSATVEGLKLERGSLTAGTIALHSPDFAVENQAFETIRLDASIPANDAIEAALILALDDKTRIEGKGGFHLKTKEYSGALGLNADLVAKGSKLRALLGGRKMADLLPGTTIFAMRSISDCVTKPRSARYGQNTD